MTEPIAVDVSHKSRPAVAPIPALPPLPKLEPSKPATPPAAAATPAPAAAPSPEPTSHKHTAKKGSFKKTLTIGASALLSLGAGIAGVKYFAPDDWISPTASPVAAVSKETTTGTPKPLVHQEQPKTAPETIPATHLPVIPVSAPAITPPAATEHGGTTHPGAFPAPTMPGAPAIAAIPTAGPTWEHNPQPVRHEHAPVPAPAFEPPHRPPVVTLAGGTEPGPMIPLIPTAGPASPPIPAIPTAGPVSPTAPTGAPPALPAVPMVGGPAAPMLPAIPSAGPAPSATPAIPPPDLTPKPAISPPPIAPAAAPRLPEPENLLAPPVAKGPSVPPAPVVGSPVSGAPVMPALPPDFGPEPATTPVKPLGAPPAAPPPAVNPQFNGIRSNPEITKPTVTPVAAIERSPTTSYDVDLHEPKAGDTYESISREFYNDTRYAAVLKTYNRNKPLQGSGPIDVPPLHVLKRYTQNQPQSGVVPVSQTGATQEWGSAPAAAAVRTGADKSFRIPTGGMSMRAVARLTLSNEQRWNDIYALNPQLRPDEILPAGTELRLPADARNP